jgi:hypothetical protein
MKRPRITTQLTGFAPREWEQIRVAAQTLLRTCPRGCVPAGTLILPGRAEVLRLEWRGSCFVLEAIA